MWLDPDDTYFPPSSCALEDPDGLLAIGGDLTTERLLAAYGKGIFPWYSAGQPIYWWTPAERMSLAPKSLHLGKSLKKLARKHPFRITVDQAFDDVIRKCATSERRGEDGTWITEEMNDAYRRLHRLGFAHSIEAWQKDQLVGGLYGVHLGKVFFGESMFSAVSGASKIAFATLASQLKKWQFDLIDCQVHTHYLESFGAKEIPRSEFESILAMSIENNLDLHQTPSINWQSQWDMPEYGLE